MSFLASLFAPRGPEAWRRLRYGNAPRMMDALRLIGEAGLELELHLAAGAGGAPSVLHVGGRPGTIGALEQMSGHFEFVLEPREGALDTQPRAKRSWAAGNWPTLPAGRAVARITPRGMFVEGPRAPGGAGAEIVLPAPQLGFDRRPEIPFPLLPATGAWPIGGRHFEAPAGIQGEPHAVRVFAQEVALGALANGRATIIVDGGDGDFIDRLRNAPAVIPALTEGRVADLRLSQAGQLGVQPLANTVDPADTLLRWCYVLGDLALEQEHLVEAAGAGIRTLPDLAKWLGDDPRRAASAYGLRPLVEAESGNVCRLLSGSFDLHRHLQGGGHVFIDIPEARGPRLTALRCVVGLALESGARLLSVGADWSARDLRALDLLDAAVTGRAWDVSVYTRCEAALADQVADQHGQPDVGEHLRTLPVGDALIYQGGDWWQATHS